MHSTKPDAVHELVARTLRMAPEEITDETGAGTDTRWTSMKLIELVVAVEETYGISLSHHQIVELRDVAALRGVLREHGVIQ